MKFSFKLFSVFTYCILFSSVLLAQDDDCVVTSTVHADGTMYYSLAPDTLYYTKSKQLLGSITTDKENYFITLYPSPAPETAGPIKKYKPLELTLSNDSVYLLECYDARILKDSVFEIMYMFDEKKNADLFEKQIKSITITSPEGSQTYNLKLHKDRLLKYFNCLKGNIKKI